MFGLTQFVCTSAGCFPCAVLFLVWHGFVSGLMWAAWRDLSLWLKEWMAQRIRTTDGCLKTICNVLCVFFVHGVKLFRFYKCSLLPFICDQKELVWFCSVLCTDPATYWSHTVLGKYLKIVSLKWVVHFKRRQSNYMYAFVNLTGSLSFEVLVSVVKYVIYWHWHLDNLRLRGSEDWPRTCLLALLMTRKRTTDQFI